MVIFQIRLLRINSATIRDERRILNEINHSITNRMAHVLLGIIKTDLLSFAQIFREVFFNPAVFFKSRQLISVGLRRIKLDGSCFERRCFSMAKLTGFFFFFSKINFV